MRVEKLLTVGHGLGKIEFKCAPWHTTRAYDIGYVQAMKGESSLILILLLILLKSMMIMIVLIILISQVSSAAHRPRRPHRTRSGGIQLRQDPQQADQQGGAGGPARENGHGDGRRPLEAATQGCQGGHEEERCLEGGD